MKRPTLDDLRRYAVGRSLFPPTTLLAALRRLGFVQADPIRAPARAQDLTLRHRVRDYRAGDLERVYARLPIEEDMFLNYGFVPREHLALWHPRTSRRPWTKTQARDAARILSLVEERGATRPQDIQAVLALGYTVNAWGGASNAVTHLMDALHYRGLLRVARREGGQRVYERVHHAATTRSAADRADALVQLVVTKYAPVTRRGLGTLVGTLRTAAPDLFVAGELKRALARAAADLPSCEVDGTTWFWPAGENPSRAGQAPSDTVRLLAPFDPVVWDRARFEIFFGFAYRFEAYTPVEKRIRGYYALPLLFRDRVIGWANLSVAEGRLVPQLGYANKPPREAAFKRELDEELHRLHHFLRLP
jgi:uncharacterized protein YcaQ